MSAWNAYTFQAYISVVLYLFHLVLYGLLRICQLISWRIAGIQSHLDRCKVGEEYETSAQLLKVWSRSKPTPFTILYQRHFLSTHVKFVHPEYSLQKHITLMTVTDKEAIFCVPSPEVNVLDVRKWPFLFEAMHQAANYILIMPVSSLIRLSKVIGEPTTKVVWIHHPGRCGSTAVAQAFNALPDVTCISEPQCCFSLNQIYKYKNFGIWDKKPEFSVRYMETFYAAICLLLKPSQTDASVVIVKGSPTVATADMKLLPKLFPKFKNIFMYREIEKQVTSIYNLLAKVELPSDVTSYIATNKILSRMFPSIRPLGFMYNSCDDKTHLEYIFKKDNVPKPCELRFFGFILNWAEICFHFRKHNEQVPSSQAMPAFKYEHWLSNRMKYLQTLFRYINLELTDKTCSVEISAEMIKRANVYLQFYDLSSWGDPFTLPNTVTGD